jgi:hypothetical protein
LGFRVFDLRLKVNDLGSRVIGIGLRYLKSEFIFQDLEFRVKDQGLMVQVLGLRG